MTAYSDRFSQFLNDSDFGVYEWKGWQVLADWATGACDLYDPYGIFVAQCNTFEEAARKAAQIDEAW